MPLAVTSTARHLDVETLAPSVTRGADELEPPTPTSGQPAQLPIPTSSSNTDPSEPSGPVIVLNGADAAAAAIAARFAQTAWTIQPGDSANSWIARVADITLADYQARLEEGARRATAAQLAPGERSRRGGFAHHARDDQVAVPGHSRHHRYGTRWITHDKCRERRRRR